MKMKWCTKGKHFQPIENFYKKKGMADGLRSECKECSKKRFKIYDQTNKAKQARRFEKIKRNYDLNKYNYEKLFEQQGGKCALCDKTKLVVDHNHQTGKVRGLLCNVHNSGLGKMGDNVEGLLMAIWYLIKAENDRNTLVNIIEMLPGWLQAFDEIQMQKYLQPDKKQTEFISIPVYSNVIQQSIFE